MRAQSSTSVLVVLTCAMGIGPLLNVGMSATSSLIIRDLEITAGQYGLFSTVCFTVAALGSLTLGRVSDRWSDRAQLLFIFGGAAASFIGAAVTMNFFWLLGVLAVAGLTQAMTNPSTNRWIMLHAPLEKRAGWIGIKQSGPQISQFFAGLFFPPAALIVGWRGAAALSAVIAVGMLVWAWNRLPVTIPAAAAPVKTVAQQKRVKVRRPKHQPRVWIFSVQLFLASIGLTATNVYLPLFAQVDLGFSLVLAGFTMAAIGLVGMVFRVLWARAMSGGQSTNTLMLVLAIGSVLGAVALLLSGELHAASLLWVGVLLHGAMALGVNVVVMAGVIRGVRSELSGAATGIVSLGLYAGIASGPLFMGLLLDLTHNFSVGWALVAFVNLVGVIFAAVLRWRGPE